MHYIALRELEMGDGRIIPPGGDVPEAADWSPAWFKLGHVAAYPDDEVEHVRAALREGGGDGLLFAAQSGNVHLAAQVAAEAKAGNAAKASSDDPATGSDDAAKRDDDAPPAADGDKHAPAEGLLAGLAHAARDLVLGTAPEGKEPVTADAGPSPAEVDDALEADADELPSDTPTDPVGDAPRRRRPRRGR